MNNKYSFKKLSKKQKHHIKLLEDKVFELDKYPSFKLLIDGIESILMKYDIDEKNICILERTKLYGTSLFGGLFENAKLTSYDCSPPSANNRGSYNEYMVNNENFIRFVDIQHINQSNLFGLPKNKFDAIFIPNLVHHFKDQSLLFAECHSALKNNGELIVFEPTFREVHQAPHDYIRYTPYGIKQIFSDYLFTDVECKEIGDSFEALTYILNVMMAKREDKDFLNWGKELSKNIEFFKKDKVDIVKDHARFPTAFLCSGFKNV
tara:strand:- start:886 stop:1677 length:792 start_codon:yes stop_codon:yes gene_type:complete